MKFLWIREYMNIICILATSQNGANKTDSDIKMCGFFWTYRLPMTVPVVWVWFGYRHPQGSSSRQGWWESFLWKWSSSIRRTGEVINLGAERSSLGWAMHRLLGEVRQPHCPGSLSAWDSLTFGAGIAVLFQGTGLVTGLLAALGISLIRNAILYPRKCSRQT